MPLYDVIDLDTNDVHEVFMTYSAFQTYLENNPHLQFVPHAPAVVSGVAGVTHKVDSGFNDVLGRIANANPHSPLAQEYGDKGVKATKTRDAVKREKVRQGI